MSVVVKFDYATAKRAADRAKRSAIIKQLSFIRIRASRDVLRRRKKPSSPGQPPNVHSRDKYASLKNIRFVYDGVSGIVGPVKLNQVNLTVASGAQPVPSIMQHGGTIALRQIRHKRHNGSGFGPWRRRDMRRRVDKGKSQLRIKRVSVAARPFMNVALQREIDSGHIMTPWVDVYEA